MPAAYTELARQFAVLEANYRDIQVIEFTVERSLAVRLPDWVCRRQC